MAVKSPMGRNIWEKDVSENFSMFLCPQIDQTRAPGELLAIHYVSTLFWKLWTWPCSESTLCTLKTHLVFGEAECWLMYRGYTVQPKAYFRSWPFPPHSSASRERRFITKSVYVCVCVWGVYWNIIVNPRKCEENHIAFCHTIKRIEMRAIKLFYFVCEWVFPLVQ